MLWGLKRVSVFQFLREKKICGELGESEGRQCLIRQVKIDLSVFFSAFFSMALLI